MSQLLETLRRGRSRSPLHARASSGSDADAVLATLGYARARRSTRHRPLAAVLVMTGIAGAIVWVWPRETPQPTPGGTPPGVRGTAFARTGTSQGATRSTPPTLPVASRDRAISQSGNPSAKRADGPARTEPSGRTENRPSEPPGRTQNHPSDPPGRTQNHPSDPSEPRDDFRLALYYQRAGDFERALTHYRAVLERDELTPAAHNNLGLLYQEKGLLDEAVREFQRATFINPRYGRAHNNLGVALMRQGRLDQATAAFETALSIDMRDTDALVNLALAQKGASDVESAKTSLLRAVTLEPSNAAAHYNLALLYDEAGEPSRAVEHYRDFLDHAGAAHASLTPDVRARIRTLRGR